MARMGKEEEVRSEEEEGVRERRERSKGGEEHDNGEASTSSAPKNFTQDQVHLPTPLFYSPHLPSSPHTSSHPLHLPAPPAPGGGGEAGAEVQELLRDPGCGQGLHRERSQEGLQVPGYACRL